MTSFVRRHGEAGDYNTSGATSVAAFTLATIPAGNALVAIVHTGGDIGSDAAPTSLTTPVGESASWTSLAYSDIGSISLSMDGSVSVYFILTTVPWPGGFSVSAAWDSPRKYRGIALSEIAGASATVLDYAEESRGTTSGNPLTVSLDPVLQAGDVTIQAAFVLNATLTENNDGTASATRYGMITDPSASGSTFKVYGAAHILTGSGSRSATYTPSGNSARGQVLVGLKAINYPPDAPTLNSMASGGVVNRGITQRASHVFSDPNAGDSQSKFDLRYRIVGDPSWTTITQTTPNQFYDFPAGALAAGDYERQVRTYDSFGVVGPWSTSGFFTAADAPDGPTITDPVNGSMIPTASEPFTWSAPDQDSYQVRKVADAAGSPDTATIYYDSGEVVDAVTRTVQLAYPANNRTEHLQVRVKFDDLWSDWASIVVDVDYTEPPTPTLELSTDPATGSLLVSITNPAPAGEDPAAIYNDVYVDDGSGEERRVTGVSPNSSWRYWLPISGRDYSTAVRVVAVAASGASSSSS